MITPLASGITTITLDHTDFLGDTIEEITAEKAGIIKKGCPVVVGNQELVAKKVLKNRAKKLNSKIYFYNESWFVKKDKLLKKICFRDNKKYLYPLPNLQGNHQIINAGIAIKSIKLIKNLKNKNEIINKGIKRVNWPARLQKIPVKSLNLPIKINYSSDLWFDGGHNESASIALSKTLKNWSKKDLYIIFGMLSSKDPKQFLNNFKYLTKKLITVPIKSDSPYCSNKKLYEIAKLNEFNVEPASSIKNALKKIFQRNESVRILICGSFYMYKEVLELMKKK